MESDSAIVDALRASKAVEREWEDPAALCGEERPQRDRRRAAKSGRRRDGKEQAWPLAGRPCQGQEAPDDRRKVRPRVCQGGGREAEEGLRGGDDGARPVDALQRAIGGGAGEVVQSEWVKK